MLHILDARESVWTCSCGERFRTLNDLYDHVDERQAEEDSA